MIGLLAATALTAASSVGAAAELPADAEVVRMVREQPLKLCASVEDSGSVIYRCIEARDAEPLEIICRTGPVPESASCGYRLDFRFKGLSGSEQIVTTRSAIQLQQNPDKSWIFLPVSNSMNF